FTAGHIGQRALRQIARAYRVERCFDHAFVVAVQRRQAPALAMQGTADEIEPAHPQVRQHRAHLWQIADATVAALWGVLEYAYVSRARRQQPENSAHQRGLAGAVGPEHADELAGADGETDIGQNAMAGNPYGCTI